MTQKEKKQIMLIVPMLDQGGLERVCALTGQLLKTEYDVHLVVFNTAGMIYDVSGVDLIDLNLGAVDSKIGKLCNVWKRVAQVKKWKRKLNIQLSYSFGPTANIVNVLSKCQDVVWAGIRGYGALEEKKRMDFVCKRADRVVSCTKIMEAEIADKYNVKSGATLYNPCDLEQIKYLKEQDNELLHTDFFASEGPIIASMGREHDVKGFWHLLKSFSVICRSIPNAKLMIIGAGEYTEYKKLAKDLGVEAQVLFTGVQKNPFAFLSKASVYALTSESEGFPNALIEAMAVGLPCVSVNCKTGPAEILSAEYEKYQDQSQNYVCEYGLLTPVFHGEKDLDATHITDEEVNFANQVIQLLQDKELFTRYQQNALERAAMFGTQAYLDNIVELMEQDTKNK